MFTEEQLAKLKNDPKKLPLHGNFRALAEKAFNYVGIKCDVLVLINKLIVAGDDKYVSCVERYLDHPPVVVPNDGSYPFNKSHKKIVVFRHQDHTPNRRHKTSVMRKTHHTYIATAVVNNLLDEELPPYGINL